MTIPIEEKMVNCRFAPEVKDGPGCTSHAVGKYVLPTGCACYTDDREQDLCGQHVMNAEPLSGGMELVLIYDAEFYKMYAPEALK